MSALSDSCALTLDDSSSKITFSHLLPHQHSATHPHVQSSSGVPTFWGATGKNSARSIKFRPCGEGWELPRVRQLVQASPESCAQLWKPLPSLLPFTGPQYRHPRGQSPSPVPGPCKTARVGMRLPPEAPQDPFFPNHPAAPNSPCDHHEGSTWTGVAFGMLCPYILCLAWRWVGGAAGEA